MFTEGPTTNWVFRGYAANVMHLGPYQEQYLGATSGTNGTSELTAQAVAAMIILSNPLNLTPGIDTLIIYDATYAQGVAESATNPTANQVIANITATIWQIVTLYHKVTWRHAYSPVKNE